MARVKPEVLYAPLAPLITDARARGLSDDEILQRLEVAKQKAREYGYTGSEIMSVHSPGVEAESRPKTFLRGLVEGLTLGFYVPESLKQNPNEIPQGINLGLGELNPGPAGEFIGGVVPFTGALKVTRPIAALGPRLLGAGRLGKIAGEAAHVGAASGLTEGVRTGFDPMATLEATGVGAAVGGAFGMARQILAGRAKVPPSEVVETEPTIEPPTLAPVEAPTIAKRPYQEPAPLLPGRGIPRENELIVRKPIEEPPRPLPTAKEQALRRAGIDPTQPAERPGTIVQPSGKPVMFNRQGQPIAESPERVDMAQVQKVAAEADAEAAKLRAPKQPPQEPPPPSPTGPPTSPQPTPPAPGVRLTVQYGKKTWKYERATQADAESLQESIKATVDPTVAQRMTFSMERVGGKAPKAKVTAKPKEGVVEVEMNVGKPATEIPAGLTLKVAAGEAVRLPEETQTASIADLLDRKGLVFRVDRSVKERPYVVVGEGGEVKRFRRLHDIIGFADSLSDDVRASTFAKGVRGEKLTPQEQQAIKQSRGRRKVANQPLPLEEDPRLSQQPPDPEVLPPTMSIDPMTGQPTIGGPGAQLALPQWVEHVIRSKKMSDPDATKFASAVNELTATDPMMEMELKAAFERPRLMSWNPLDALGQPQAARNRLVSQAARETANVEMAWDFEAKKWDEYFTKHFSHLNDKEAEQTARLIEGELKPGAASDRVQQAAAAWQVAAEDFAKRLGVPQWAEYLTRLTDMQGVYEQWRPHILSAKRFEDLSETMQFKIGSENVFNTMRRAFEKQDKWDGLPQDVRLWTKERLLNWFDGAQWDSLPEFVKSRVPKEVFDRFLLPRTGGLPYVRDVRKSFQAYVPIALKKLHVDPLLDRWQTLANNLPGSSSHPLSEGYYLRKYLTRFEGRESVGLDRVTDGIVRVVEDRLGKALADPNILSRLASRAASWTYRGALGVDSAFINTTQSINTWAASGSTPFLKGLGRFLAGESRSRPNVGVLREFNDIYVKGEFTGQKGEGFRGGIKRLADIDEKITRIALSPMSIAENINRGVGFLAGMEEAAALGLDTSQALRMGFARASKVVPNLELTRAQLNAVHRVAQTQFAYSAAFRSPYLAGPLARLSTLFWSYPTRQLQFATDGLADGIHSVLTQPSMDNVARTTRFAALLGLMVGGASLGAQIGLNLENLYGMRGMFPKVFAGPLGLITQGYNLATTGKPVSQQDIDRVWNDALTFVVPQYRYGKKVLWGEDSVRKAAERGYRVDELGRQTYHTTPYGEYMRALGLEYGQAYRERVAVRTILEENARRMDDRKSALNAAVQGDFGPATKYNGKYPELPLTERDLQNEIKLRQTPLVERVGPLYLRQRAIESLRPRESDLGIRP